jgi:hypothetical protein
MFLFDKIYEITSTPLIETPVLVYLSGKDKRREKRKKLRKK